MSDPMTAPADLGAVGAMMEGVTAQFRQAPRPHRSGEAVLDVVYADPGTHGFYYRDRKPDSVAAFVRMDHVAALAAEVRTLRVERDKLIVALDIANDQIVLLTAHAESDQYRADATVAALRARVEALMTEAESLTDLVRWAHDTLWELNPSNYDHDEVCKVNDAAVAVILGLAPAICETHGKSAEWWADRARADLPPTLAEVMARPDVRALVEAATTVCEEDLDGHSIRRLRRAIGSLRAALARLKGDTP